MTNDLHKLNPNKRRSANYKQKIKVLNLPQASHFYTLKMEIFKKHEVLACTNGTKKN